MPRPRRPFRITVEVAAAAALAVCAAVIPTAAQATAPAAATASGPSVTSKTLHSATAQQVFRGGLYNDSNSVAAQAKTKLQKAGATADAAVAAAIAEYPTAIWLGDWYTDAQTVKVIDQATTAAAKTGTTATFVTYAIPDRDCGHYSAGGRTAETYNQWTGLIADHLRGTRSVVLIEPDSLALLTNCPDVADARYPLIRKSVHQFADANVPAYLDGGNSNWNKADLQAHRLRTAWVAGARGFYTNVSSYYPTEQEQAYAEEVSKLTGGAHYVIDTSRNGSGWKGTWCNPAGAGLGKAPAVSTGGGALDALLWVKTAGTSDGTCNGGPAAGTWWPTFASELLTHRAG